MRGNTSRWVIVCALVSACGTGDTRIDPGDLELRDLLGVAPDAATRWNEAQRDGARRVLEDGLRAARAAERIASTTAEPVDALAKLDELREARGDDAAGAVVVVLDGGDAIVETHASTALGTAPRHAAVDIVIDESWSPELAARGLDVMSALAADLGHATGPVVVVAAPRLPAIAAYVAHPARLLVNPVLIAALEPTALATEAQEAERIVEHVASSSPVAESSSAGSLGNPYSFYGSIGECAAALRSRCDACLPSSSCKPITNATDGNTECNMLGANNGRGYFLECINLALAISSVERCAKSKAASCPQDTQAADSLASLESNARFLDDPTCGEPLDGCLAQIYGAPSTTFPGADGGISTEPPRSTSVSCGNACSSNNPNCEASPSCNFAGPSCNNALSCDNACGGSGNKGCGEGCSSGGSGGSSSGGGCGGSSSGGSSSGSCGSCGSSSGGSSSSGCGGGSSSSGSCGSCGSSSGGGSSSSGCSGGSCGGSSGGSSSGCSGGSCGGGSSGSSCGGGSSGKCSVAAAEPSPVFAIALSIMWALLPVPLAARARRKARRQRARDEEVNP